MVRIRNNRIVSVGVFLAALAAAGGLLAASLIGEAAPSLGLVGVPQGRTVWREPAVTMMEPAHAVAVPVPAPGIALPSAPEAPHRVVPTEAHPESRAVPNVEMPLRLGQWPKQARVAKPPVRVAQRSAAQKIALTLPRRTGRMRAAGIRPSRVAALSSAGPRLLILGVGF